MDTLVTRLQVGPHNRDQQPWNRQLLMLEKLPSMFPCLREINFDQVRPALRHFAICAVGIHTCCVALSCKEPSSHRLDTAQDDFAAAQPSSCKILFDLKHLVRSRSPNRMLRVHRSCLTACAHCRVWARMCW